MQQSIAIDYGTKNLRAGFFDGHEIKFITSGKTLLEIREGSEIFFNEFVNSCVIAVPDEYSAEKLNAIKSTANEAGFENVKFITKTQAKIKFVNSNKTFLILDAGYLNSELEIISNSAVEKNLTLKNFSGNKFDNIFAKYLSLRLSNEINDNEAGALKRDLSEREIIKLNGRKVLREDFERLIRFEIFDVINFLNSNIRIYEPEKIFITGGLINIPIVKNLLYSELKIKPEFINNIILNGTSLLAGVHDKNNNAEARLKALEKDFMLIQELLTPSQNDRLYKIFTLAKDLKDAANLHALEELLNGIKRIAPLN